MEITVAIIVYSITLLLGEITKATSIPNKYIPLQNVIIAILSSIICIVFKVEGLGILETVITCLLSSLGAGGTVDIKKVTEKQ